MTVQYKHINIYITANYLLSIRDNVQCGEAFATAVHELGHLFCHHLTAVPRKAWEIRYLNHASNEFEAESVSYIVCARLGIKTTSADYLSGYCKKNKTIPAIVLKIYLQLVTTFLTWLKVSHLNRAYCTNTTIISNAILTASDSYGNRICKF